MKTKSEILSIIYASIDEINEINELKIMKDPSTRLFGAGSDLDSLGLVNFIVSVEGNINNKFNTTISIADDRAMSQKNSPFRNIDTLSDYIMTLLNEVK